MSNSTSSSGHRVIVYYQTQYDSSLSTTPNSAYGYYISPLPLLTLITHLILAAFHINKDKSIHLNDNIPEDPMFDQMWSDVAELRSGGVKVLGMLGGAAQGSYEMLSGSNFEVYYPLLKGYIEKYQLDGMDLDVEESTSLSDISNLITTLKSDFGDSFLITLAPVSSALLLPSGPNLSGFSYSSLEQLLSPQISWYNAQFYSGFGTLFPDTQYIEIINETSITPERVVATTLTNPADGSGYVDAGSVVSSVGDLAERYGWEFGGVAGWEYFNSIPEDGSPWKWAELMKGAMEDIKAKKAALAKSSSGVRRSRVSKGWKE